MTGRAKTQFDPTAFTSSTSNAVRAAAVVEDTGEETEPTSPPDDGGTTENGEETTSDTTRLVSHATGTKTCLDNQDLGARN